MIRRKGQLAAIVIGASPVFFASYVLQVNWRSQSILGVLKLMPLCLVNSKRKSLRLCLLTQMTSVLFGLTLTQFYL